MLVSVLEIVVAATVVVVLAVDGHVIQKRSNACYVRVGCFSDAAPFTSPQRLITLLPVSPDSLSTQYMLYTRESTTKASLMDARYPDSFANIWPNYNTSRPTKVIIHGFMDSVHLTSWLREMKTELLIQGDYNVIIVDWHHGNLPPYTQATGNTRLVGAQIADLVNTIRRATSQPASSFHLIGHSLGAHIAGYAGERVIGLGRISGLDPAGPYFEGTDKIVRLDPTDATFVDVIHTDAESILNLGLGIDQDVGHVDFYPNLGHDQPGCQKSPLTKMMESGLVEGTGEIVACNHLRSIKLFLESINAKCPFKAFPCRSEDDFQNGRCQSCGQGGCSSMGMHADQNKPGRNQHIKYFLKTGQTKPFCEYHLDVTVHLMRPSSGSSSERGVLKIRVFGSKGYSNLITLNDSPQDFYAGTSYHYTVGVSRDLGSIQRVTFTWHHSSSLLDIGGWNPFGLRHPMLYVKEIDVRSHETSVDTHMCGPIISVETDDSISLSMPC